MASPKPLPNQPRFSNREIHLGAKAKEKYDAALRAQKEFNRTYKAEFNKNLKDIVKKVIFKS